MNAPDISLLVHLSGFPCKREANVDTSVKLTNKSVLTGCVSATAADSRLEPGQKAACETLDYKLLVHEMQ